MKHHRADTRGRLLSAARDIFYKHGYNRATIQMIATKARANIAAVNYHFGDKATLLAVVLAEDMAELHQSMPRIDSAPNAPADQLKAFVEWYLKRFQANCKLAPLMKEIANGGEVLAAMIQDVGRPETEALCAILAALDPKAELDVVQRRAVCLMAMLAHSVSYSPLLTTLFSNCRIPHEDPSDWADVISQICLSGTSA